MADVIITKETELSVLVPAVWSQKYYDVLIAELPFNSLISRDYEGEIQALGDRVKISTIPEFSDAEIVGEADRADASALTATQQELIINKQIVKDFMVTSRALLQSIPFMEKMKEMAIYAINKKIQGEIISATVPNGSAPAHSIAYVSAAVLALVDILAAKQLLDNQNVPMGDRHLVVGARSLNQIFNITGFTSSDFVASGAPLQSGQLPAQLLGFMPHFTSVVGGTSYFFHSTYMAIAAQKGLTVGEYAQDVTGLRATRVNCDTLIGIKQLDPLRVVTIS
jgi:hypothetical protein